ncbi:uncharacterized protein [Ptychodera flava]
MRVVMPDGSIRVMTVATRVRGSCQPVTADTLYQYDNPIIVNSNVQTSNTVQTSSTVQTNSQGQGQQPVGQFPRPPSYSGQLETKDNQEDLPPAYAAIFNQTESTAQESGIIVDGTNNTNPAVLPTATFEGISPPPYSPMDTSTSTGLAMGENSTGNTATAPQTPVTSPPYVPPPPTVETWSSQPPPPPTTAVVTSPPSAN